MIEYAVRKHFPDLPDTSGPQTYARNYLEKLIQVPFRIPALGEIETRIFVTLLLIGAELKDDDPDFAKLIAVARERLKRPWTGTPIDAPAVKAALGAKSTHAENALILSAQVGPILASGTRGNPRQIKRFLNTLLLRQASAMARGFGEDVKLPVLAKLMLAERFNPKLFDQIALAAAASPDGRCVDLGALEEVLVEKAEQTPGPVAKAVEARIKTEARPTPKPEVVKPAESAQLSEWRTSDWIKSWAQISPAIGRLDLRPYLFVAKDRKDYFGATTILGKLAGVGEKLLGTKLAVQAFESELKQLAGLEAAQVFDFLRSRIVAADSFETEPAGTAGLEVLVKVHPSLQSGLVDFLESLPKQRLGPWACSGWGNVIRDAESSQRYERLLETWKKEGGPMLRTAAEGILRMRKQGTPR
jgi:hypothetical protein